MHSKFIVPLGQTVIMPELIVVRICKLIQQRKRPKLQFWSLESIGLELFSLLHIEKWYTTLSTPIKLIKLIKLIELIKL